MKFKVDNWITIQEDDNSGIIMAKDNYKSVAVQIVWQNNSTVADAQGQLQPHRNIFCVYSKSVYTHHEEDGFKTVINPNFKSDLQKAVSDVKKYYAFILEYEKMIDGALNDYKSQHKDLNKEES